MGATKINLEVDEKVLFSFFFFFCRREKETLGVSVVLFLGGNFYYMFFRLSSVDCVDFSYFLAFFSLFTFQFASFVLYF